LKHFLEKEHFVLLPRGSAEATAAATDEDAENDEEEKAAKDEDPLRLQTAFPCRNLDRTLN